MPATRPVSPDQDKRPAPGPVTAPPAEQPAKGSEVQMARCPVHGVTYDGEREVCPECAKAGG
jgi:hypothetical protein